MICPQCRSEYRPGFVHCSSCGVDLVEDLASAPVPSPGSVRARHGLVSEADLLPYCGFLSLEDARHAREELRGAGIRSDILVRESGEEGADATAEEYWIRVPRSQFAAAAQVLEEQPAAAEGGGNGEVSGLDEDDETFACSACGEDVGSDADACPRCGARFDE